MNSYCVTFFNEFENEFEILKHSISDTILLANELIKFIERKIKELFKWLKTYVFENSTEESYFFKELKPKLISKLIFYKSVLKLESNLPVSKKLKQKYYEKSLNKVYQQSKKDRDFYRYYRSKCTNKDEQYFMRNYEKSITNDDCSLVNYDENLCSTHDYKVANLIANDLLSVYLEDRLERIKNLCNIEHPLIIKNLSKM